MKENYWKYIAIIFLVLNVFLIYSQRREKVENENLIRITEETQNEVKENSFSFPSKVESDLLSYPDENLKVYFFFNDRGCRDCIDYEVAKINALSTSFNEYLEVFLMSQDSTYLSRLYGASFNYKRIDALDFENLRINSLEPFALVIDKNGFVQQNYFAARNAYDEADKFYSKLTSLLESL